MMAHPSEETLSLHLSRDLEPAQSTEILRHLDSCGQCQGKLEQLRTMRSMLIEAMPEPLEEDVQTVRQALLRTIAGQRIGSARRWLWNAAAAAVGCLAIALLLLKVYPDKRPKPNPAPPLALAVPVIAPREIAAVSLPPKHHNRQARQEHVLAGIRSVSWNVEQDGTSQLRITTGDPNVVILLPMQNTGDKHEN